MRAVTTATAFYSPLAAEVGGALNWVFFAAGPVLAGFETATPAPVVAELWRLATASDATVESVVASIPTRGPDAVDTFAVVVLGDPVTIVVRGSARVDIQTAQGQRRIDSRGMQPWYLAEFAGALGGSLGSAERPAGAVTEAASSDLPLQSGLIRAPWLAWASNTGPARAARPERANPAPGLFRPRGAAATEPRTPRPVTGSIPVQKLAAAPDARAKPITTPIPVIPAMPGTDATRDSSPVGGEGASDDTLVPPGGGKWSLLGRATRAEQLASSVDRAGGDIDDTIVTSRQRHRADAPAMAAWSPGRLELDPRFRSGGPTARHHGFRVGDGAAYRLDTPVYIGRKPRSPRIVTGTVPRLLKVASPSREISGTHIELRQEGDRVVVTDMRTTNGTFVAQPGQSHVKLRQGESLVVAPGTLVDIGDGVVIEILPVS